MIPYRPSSWARLLEIGPFELHLFSVLVLLGIVAGVCGARFRARQLGLSQRGILSLASWVLVGGFLAAHGFDVLAYQRGVFSGNASDGLLTLLNPFDGLSSFGGFLGAWLSLLLWTRRTRYPLLACADCLMYGLAFGWFFGRLGCFSTHDHLGAASSSLLAVRFPGGSRHDLGLDEALFAGGLTLAFAVLSARPRPVGFFAALACCLYGPLRFALDFLRVRDVPGADPRSFGLTPAQYGSILIAATGAVLVTRLSRRDVPSPAIASGR